MAEVSVGSGARGGILVLNTNTGKVTEVFQSRADALPDPSRENYVRRGGGGGGSSRAPTVFQSQLLQQSFPSEQARRSAESTYLKNQEQQRIAEESRQSRIQQGRLGGQISESNSTIATPSAKEELLQMSIPPARTSAGGFIRGINTRESFIQQRIEEDLLKQQGAFQSLSEEQLINRVGSPGSGISGMSTPKGSSFTFSADREAARARAKSEFGSLPITERLRLRASGIGVGLARGVTDIFEFGGDVISGLGVQTFSKPSDLKQQPIFGRTRQLLTQVEAFRELRDRPTGTEEVVGEATPIVVSVVRGGSQVVRGFREGSALGLSKGERASEFIRSLSPLQTQTAFQPIITSRNIPVGRITRFPTEYGSVDVFQGSLSGVPGSRVTSLQVSGRGNIFNQEAIIGRGLTEVSVPQTRLIGNRLISGRSTQISETFGTSPVTQRQLGFARSGISVSPEGLTGERTLSISRNLIRGTEFRGVTDVRVATPPRIAAGRGPLYPTRLAPENLIQVERGVAGELSLGDDGFLAFGAHARGTQPFGELSFVGRGRTIRPPTQDSGFTSFQGGRRSTPFLSQDTTFNLPLPPISSPSPPSQIQQASVSSTLLPSSVQRSDRTVNQIQARFQGQESRFFQQTPQITSRGLDTRQRQGVSQILASSQGQGSGTRQRQFQSSIQILTPQVAQPRKLTFPTNQFPTNQIASSSFLAPPARGLFFVSPPITRFRSSPRRQRVFTSTAPAAYQPDLFSVVFRRKGRRPRRGRFGFSPFVQRPLPI